jgi:hypothetical protein
VVDGVSYHSYSGWGRSETLPLLVAQVRFDQSMVPNEGAQRNVASSGGVQKIQISENSKSQTLNPKL